MKKIFILIGILIFCPYWTASAKGASITMQKLRVFIEAIRTETLGFSFGNPWRHDEGSITCVLPILRETKENDPKYLTLTKNSKVEIKDSGKIDLVLVTNNEDKPVFLRMGQLLAGDTQNRTVVMSRVVMTGETAKVNVKCVHASHGINMGSIFRSHGYSPDRDAFYTSSLHVSGSVNQGSSWSMDRGYYSRAQSRLQSFASMPGETPIQMPKFSQDNLTAIRDAYNNTMEDVLKKVPLLENQIGMALIDTKGFYSLDCFDLHASWKAVKEELTKKESLAIAEKDESGVFEYKPDKAKDTVTTVLGTGFNEKVQHQEPKTETITIDFGKYVGEAVSLDGEVIHLLIARK